MDVTLLLSLALMAAGVAANPAGIVIQIGVLSSHNGRAKGVTYLAGALSSLLMFAVLAVALFGRSDLSTETVPGTTSLVVHLVGGLVVVGLGVFLWRQPAQAVGGFIGKALKNLETIKLRTVFILGFLVINYALEFAGATTVLKADLPTTAASIGYYLFFLVLASSTLWIPLAVQIALPSRWDAWSTASRDWIVEKGNVVLGALIGVLGLLIAGQAALALMG